MDAVQFTPTEHQLTHGMLSLSNKAKATHLKPIKPSRRGLYLNISTKTHQLRDYHEITQNFTQRKPQFAPLRDKFPDSLEDKRSKSVFPTEALTARREVKVKLSPSIEYSFTRISDNLPKLPKRHFTFMQRNDEGNEVFDELISKTRFNELVQRSYKHIKRTKAAPKLTAREQKNLEVNRRKREELTAMMLEMNSSKEARFAEIVENVRRDFGMKDEYDSYSSKFNSFDRTPT